MMPKCLKKAYHTFVSHAARCRFGGVAVQATRISPSEIQCYAPPLDAGTYPLEVSLNDQDYTSQRFPFLFFDDQVTSKISTDRRHSVQQRACVVFGCGVPDRSSEGWIVPEIQRVHWLVSFTSGTQPRLISSSLRA